MESPSRTDTAFVLGKYIDIEPLFHARSFHFNDKLVFVLMPFSELWSDRVWEQLKNIIESKNLQAERANNRQGPIITEDIWTGIMEARLVVCDTTGWNPNVFYELGIAHTVGKPVILITQPSKAFPFDTQGLRHIIYSDNPDGMRKLSQELPLHINFYMARRPAIRVYSQKGSAMSVERKKEPFKRRELERKASSEIKLKAKLRWKERSPEYDPELPSEQFPKLRTELGTQRAYLKKITYTLSDDEFKAFLSDINKNWPSNWDGLTARQANARMKKAILFVHKWSEQIQKNAPVGVSLIKMPMSDLAKKLLKVKKDKGVLKKKTAEKEKS